MSEGKTDRNSHGYIVYPGNNSSLIESALKKRNIWHPLAPEKDLLSAALVWKQLNLASNLYGDFEDVLKCYPQRHVFTFSLRFCSTTSNTTMCSPPSRASSRPSSTTTATNWPSQGGLPTSSRSFPPPSCSPLPMQPQSPQKRHRVQRLSVKVPADREEKFLQGESALEALPEECVVRKAGVGQPGQGDNPVEQHKGNRELPHIEASKLRMVGSP